MTNEEIAWLAGIIEGEGSITVNNGRRGDDSTYPLLRVAMTDEDIIRRLPDITGVGRIRLVQRQSPRKNIWEWGVGARDDNIYILNTILPWMGNRRSEKIKEALIKLSRPFKIGPDVNPCGTYPGAQRHTRNGEPECDECKEARRTYQREWEREYRRKKKEKDESSD